MDGRKMNNKDLTEDFSASNVYETLTGLLSGDIGAGVKLMEIGINSIKSIPDYLFYRNLTAVLSELIIPGLFEPPVRTLRATIPENESHIFR